MAPSARFWDKVAERYARSPVKDEESYQRKLRETRAHFTPEMELLEFGCGTGSTALRHAPHVRHILATDISAKMLEIARRKAADQGIDNVSFEVTAIEDLRAPDGAFDMVLGLNILHLLEDKEAAIAKVRRLLKPGGLFVSSTVCLTGLFRILQLVGPLGRLLGKMPLVRFFTAQEVLDSLTAAGFAIETQWQHAGGRSLFVIARKA